MIKNKAAQELGRRSAEKRGIHKMTKEQRSAYMKAVRAGKSPKQDDIVYTT